jgi:Mrp family chromosome partitioning ATPase
MVYAKSLTKPAGRQRGSSFDEGKGGIREKLDHVLIGAPPVELVSDPTIIATQSGGVLLVMDAQETGKGHSKIACTA